MVYIETQHVDHDRASSGPLEKKQKRALLSFRRIILVIRVREGGRGKKEGKKKTHGEEGRTRERKLQRLFFIFFFLISFSNVLLGR